MGQIELAMASGRACGVGAPRSTTGQHSKLQLGLQFIPDAGLAYAAVHVSSHTASQGTQEAENQYSKVTLG